MIFCLLKCYSEADMSNPFPNLLHFVLVLTAKVEVLRHIVLKRKQMVILVHCLTCASRRVKSGCMGYSRVSMEHPSPVLRWWWQFATWSRLWKRVLQLAFYDDNSLTVDVQTPEMRHDCFLRDWISDLDMSQCWITDLQVFNIKMVFILLRMAFEMTC